jgi:hypothetical protein
MSAISAVSFSARSERAKIPWSRQRRLNIDSMVADATRAAFWSSHRALKYTATFIKPLTRRRAELSFQCTKDFPCQNVSLVVSTLDFAYTFECFVVVQICIGDGFTIGCFNRLESMMYRGIFTVQQTQVSASKEAAAAARARLAANGVVI